MIATGMMRCYSQLVKLREFDDLPATISVEHAARLLSIGRASAYRAAHTGQLPTIKFGRRLLVPTARLAAMLGATNSHGLDAHGFDGDGQP